MMVMIKNILAAGDDNDDDDDDDNFGSSGQILP